MYGPPRGSRQAAPVEIGEGGIRTLGTSNRYNSLAGSPIRPLSHLSYSLTTYCPERVGFEPTVPEKGTTVFKTASFNHSDTSP